MDLGSVRVSRPHEDLAQVLLEAVACVCGLGIFIFIPAPCVNDAFNNRSVNHNSEEKVRGGARASDRLKIHLYAPVNEMCLFNDRRFVRRVDGLKCINTA